MTRRSLLQVLHESESFTSAQDLLEYYNSLDWEQIDNASPDVWFNLGTQFSIYDLESVALAIYQKGIERWPDSVDLHCAVLQYRYSHFADRGEAAKIWQRLKDIDDAHLYWRFWVYGAIYHARLLRAPAEAFEILIEGLTHVPAKDVANLYRNIPSIAVHFPPDDSLDERYDRMVALLRSGIERAPLEGYTLAIVLSEVLQRRASSDTEKARGYLEEAMQAVRIAEMMFDGGDSNHPLSVVLFAKAKILVALNRHTEALPMLRAIEAIRDRERRVDMRSVRAMRILCEHVLGEVEESGEDDLSPSKVVAAFGAMLEEHGARLLVMLAQQSPTLGRHVQEAARMLGG